MTQTLINILRSKYPAQVPRYTSYPAAPHFHALTHDIYESWLRAVPDSSAVSLYVHIPYCKKLCWFCGCHTRISQQYKPVENYLAPLLKEVRMVAEKIGRKQPVSHIHFGGGSPTILTCEDFSLLMHTLHQHFVIGNNAEIAIEIDPRGFTEAKAACYASLGVNRVSIGVQDFDLAVQKAVNRIQPFHMVYDTVKLCRNYGIRQISFDLIYGLPEQTLEGLQRSLECALMFVPNRIALFGYAHVPWKKKNIRMIDESALPDDTARYAMFEAASSQLKAAGYLPIGLDHFAKADDSMGVAWKEKKLKRNFQGYTTDGAEALIGLGASAISSFPQGYAQNAAMVEEYERSLAADELPTRRGFSLTIDDRLRRTIIESLMCYSEVDIKQICGSGLKLVSYFDDVLKRLQPMQQDGLVSIEGYVIRVNPSCPQAVRVVCAEFDTYSRDGTAQHSRVA